MKRGGERLVTDDGSLRVGVFSEPVDEINHLDFPLTDPFGRPLGRIRRHFAFNQFQFLGVLSEALVFGCALAHLKYAGSAFVYLYDPTTRRLEEHSFKRPFGLGIHVDQRPEDGRATFDARGCSIAMEGGRAPRERRLRVRVGDRLFIETTFHEEEPTTRPMFICTRAGASGWVFARKTAGVPVSGSVRWDGTTIDLQSIDAHGHHDWTAGYMRRHTFWNWGCLSGRLADGRRVGLNVSCGVNETSFTENCFWLDGALHKLDTVAFDYDRSNPEKPWRLTSFDGRLALDFVPQDSHAERINAGIVASNFKQLIGRHSGWLETSDGERVPIEGMLGYAETHYAKW